MTLPLIIYRSLRQHALSTLVTAASIALACGLLMSVWVVKVQTQQAFLNTSTAFDAVLGPRSAKLQLVLNSIFHLEVSPGNITLQDYEQVRRHPAVKTAIPIAVGDNHQGWKIVGTLPEIFTATEYAPGKPYRLASGSYFSATVSGEGANARQAVIGSFAAESLGLKVGSTFHPYHGLAYNPEQEHKDEYTVAGILAPTNTPTDRVIWIPLSGMQTMAGHDAAHAENLSAVLIQLRARSAGLELSNLYNKPDGRLTFAYPVDAIIADFFEKISWFDRILALVAYLIVLVATGSVLASIYSSMSARQRDIAILRALGASRGTVFGTVVYEAMVIGALGAVCSFLVYFVLMGIVAELIHEQTGVMISITAWHPVLVLCPLGMIALAAVGGLAPACKAYRVPVAQTLSPLS